MSFPGQTSRSAAYWRRNKPERPPIDPTITRYFIYALLDSAGEAVYVGRSCNVANRLRAHYRNLNHPDETQRTTWLLEARSVTLLGPYTWDDACQVERREIERRQPRGNRMYTRAHGYRPLAEGGGRYLGAPSP